jgi:hypothetical protein
MHVVALGRRVLRGCGPLIVLVMIVLVVIVLAVLVHGAEHTPQGCVRWWA